jgi:hypothetical protein
MPSDDLIYLPPDWTDRLPADWLDRSDVAAAADLGDEYHGYQPVTPEGLTALVAERRRAIEIERRVAAARLSLLIPDSGTRDDWDTALDALREMITAGYDAERAWLDARRTEALRGGFGASYKD